MKYTWQGVFPAVTTQFKADQALDLPATARQVEMLLQHDMHGIIMLGTVGENCALEPAEKLAVLQTAREAIRSRVPLLAGVAECSTAAACDSIAFSFVPEPCVLSNEAACTSGSRDRISRWGRSALPSRISLGLPLNTSAIVSQ